ncbi:hypothetical protein [Streptomyces sp. CC208A]|uniref:hypothetical protein n=1 Tax=Streptomyces sp. CC208A TaxID=3044573 RepID=UPI0024A9CF60|nr:hypothetical protein [Streptomyces sp. CC208A]
MTGCDNAERAYRGSLTSGQVAARPDGSYSYSASAGTASADEDIRPYGTAGYYRYLVHAYSGSGTSTLGLSAP